MDFYVPKNLRKCEYVEYIKALLEKENIYSEFKCNSNLFIRWDKSYKAIVEEKKLKEVKKLNAEKSDAKQNTDNDEKNFKYVYGEIIDIVKNVMVIAIMLVTTIICFWILEILHSIR